MREAMMTNENQTPRLSPASVRKSLVMSFNDKFQAAVNAGTAKVETEKTTVKNPIADENGKYAEVPYEYPKVTILNVADAEAYFSDPILDKDGKVEGFGYRSADGKTQKTPTELVWEAFSKFVTNSEKASIRAKTLNDLIPEDVKATHKAAWTMVLAGKFGGDKDAGRDSEQNIKAHAKALAVLTAAAE